MGDRYIWGVQLLVEDVPGAKRWLCENLFFVEEDHKGMICLRNGNFRLVLREDKEHLADKYGPDDMCLGFRHIALETHDIEAAIAYCESRGLNLQLGENGGPRYSGKVYGTGTLDMKGGITIAIYAVRSAVLTGFKKPIRFVLAGDEEINHLESRAADIMEEEAKGAICAFNMETGLINNKLAVFRKGGTRCRITTHGVEAHAGNDFTKGRSAIVEMAYKVVDIHGLTDLTVGTTMNIGTIFNAVPAKCEAVVDMRFEKNEELEKAKKNLEAVCEKTYIDGTTTEMKYITCRHPDYVSES